MEGGSIGPYRIVRKLGEGGMGTVWLGEHTLLGRRAAIKVLLPEYSTNATIVQRFFNEARAVTAIADPGIVQVFDFGQAAGSAYIIMELLEGEAMDARLQRIGRFMPTDAMRLMAQIATSLGAAHAKGVIHRDLKPENIFIVGDPAVTGGERTKILDFGIAKLSGDDAGMQKTRTGVVMGTPVYMSPEQCRGASTIDARSDIYALGCVLFTMLCGRPPFESEGSGDLIIMHVRDQPPSPSSVVPDLIPEIDEFVARCLEKDPNRRFQSTAEMVHGLAQVEAALFGIGENTFIQSMQMPGADVARRSRPSLSPAAAMAYRQQHTPPQGAAHEARTQIARPASGFVAAQAPGFVAQNEVTTIQGASGQQTPPMHATRPRRIGVVIGVAGALIACGVVAIVALKSRGGNARAAANEPTADSESTMMASPPTTPPGPPPVVAPPELPSPSPQAVAPPQPEPAVPAPTPTPVSTPPAPPAPADAGSAASIAAAPTPTQTPRPTTRPRTKRQSGGTTAKGSNAPATIDRGD